MVLHIPQTESQGGSLGFHLAINMVSYCFFIFRNFEFLTQNRIMTPWSRAHSPWGSRCRSPCSRCQGRACLGSRSPTWVAPWCRASRWSRSRPPARRAWPGDPWRVCAGDGHYWGLVTTSDVPHVWSVDVSPHCRRISEKLIVAPWSLCAALRLDVTRRLVYCAVQCTVQCRAQPVLCCTVLCHLPRLAWAAAATTAEKIATELWRYLLLCYRQKRSKLVFNVDKIPID